MPERIGELGRRDSTGPPGCSLTVHRVLAWHLRTMYADKVRLGSDRARSRMKMGTTTNSRQQKRDERYALSNARNEQSRIRHVRTCLSRTRMSAMAIGCHISHDPTQGAVRRPVHLMSLFTRQPRCIERKWRALAMKAPPRLLVSENQPCCSTAVSGLCGNLFLCVRGLVCLPE